MYLKYLLQYLAKNYDWYLNSFNPDYKYPVLELEDFKKAIRRPPA